jgi:hypothetical protein
MSFMVATEVGQLGVISGTEPFPLRVAVLVGLSFALAAAFVAITRVVGFTAGSAAWGILMVGAEVVGHALRAHDISRLGSLQSWAVSIGLGALIGVAVTRWFDRMIPEADAT